MALWGGRFTQAADTRVKQFNDSLRFDYRLAEQDIVGSLAWSKALVSVHVLTEEEQQRTFGKLKELFDHYHTSLSNFDTLSVGMSGDMVEAIENGSTMVRIGTAIFGKRN